MLGESLEDLVLQDEGIQLSEKEIMKKFLEGKQSKEISVNYLYGRRAFSN